MKACFLIEYIPLLKRSFIVADRFYNDFSLLHIWDSSEVFFVVRHKKNISYKTIRENSFPENRHQNILIDEVIDLQQWLDHSFEEHPPPQQKVVQGVLF